MTRNPTDEEQKGPGDPLRVRFRRASALPDRDGSLLPRTRARKKGVNQAVLLVDSEQNVKDVVARIKELGLESRAAVEFIERERLIYPLIFGGMTCVAAVCLWSRPWASRIRC